MGFRKKLLGVGEYNFEVLYVVAVGIRDCRASNEISQEEFQEIWELWEWMAFWQLNEGSITENDFARLYLSLGMRAGDFKFGYQKDDQEIGRKFGVLYENIKEVIRPSLSIAFLPHEYGSENWPVSGRPVRNVSLRDGYGSILPEQITRKVVEAGFKIDFTSSQMATIYIISNAFIQILKISNEKERQVRLGMRLSAFEVLPFFICFDLFKFRQ